MTTGCSTTAVHGVARVREWLILLLDLDAALGGFPHLICAIPNSRQLIDTGARARRAGPNYRVALDEELRLVAGDDTARVAAVERNRPPRLTVP